MLFIKRNTIHVLSFLCYRYKLFLLFALVQPLLLNPVSDGKGLMR